MPSRNPLRRKSVVRWIASYETPVPTPSFIIASMTVLRVMPTWASGSSTVNMFQLWPGLSRGGRHLGREEVVIGEELEVEVREARSRAAPIVQVRELLQAEARGDVGEVVLGARVLHVARAVGQALDAMEAQLLHDRALALVVQHEGAALDRGHVLVRVEAERDEVAARTHGAARVARTDGKRRVLQDAHLVALGEFVEQVRVERRVPVRGQQQLRARE